jgi:hypothetical protein
MDQLGSLKELVEGLHIPQSWPDVTAFARWYFESSMPFMPPYDAQVVATDDATAVVLFRHGQFQVEQYLIHKQEKVKLHSHPHIRELVTVNFGGGGQGPLSPYAHVNAMWGVAQPLLKAGEIHESADLQRESNPDGYVLLSFEWWADGVKPTSAAFDWCGFAAGPKHMRLLLERFPHAWVCGDFIDITKTPEAEGHELNPPGIQDIPIAYRKDQRMIEFNVVSQNPDGTLRVEYPVYTVSDIPVPLDAQGIPLRAQPLYLYLREQVDRLNGDVVPMPLDPEINERLGLDQVDVTALGAEDLAPPFDVGVQDV